MTEEIKKDMCLIFAGWYCAHNDDFYGDGSPWDWLESVGIMQKYGITREDIKQTIPLEWVC